LCKHATNDEYQSNPTRPGRLHGIARAGELKQPTVMLIRSANADDTDAIGQVHIASWRHAYRAILPAEFLAGLSVVQRRAMWAEAVAKDLPHLLVAEVQGQVVGFSAIGPCRDEGSARADFELWAIYALPSQWSTGIGRELWHASCKVLRSRGSRHVSLWVIANNERAIKFYTAAGFMPEAHTRRSFELGGAHIEEVRYVQSLQD